MNIPRRHPNSNAIESSVIKPRANQLFKKREPKGDPFVHFLKKIILTKLNSNSFRSKQVDLELQLWCPIHLILKVSHSFVRFYLLFGFFFIFDVDTDPTHTVCANEMKVRLQIATRRKRRTDTVEAWIMNSHFSYPAKMLRFQVLTFHL